MKLQEHVPISSLTTMRLGGEAAYVATIETAADVAAAYTFAAERGLPTWIMGGGANTIGRDEGFPGVILLDRSEGISLVVDDRELPLVDLDSSTLGDRILLRGQSGEPWDRFVEAACRLGYSGIEAMSAIPGTLGAAPVQNIGAYGQDLSQTLHSVTAYDRTSGESVTLARSDLRLDYRSTTFNSGPAAGRYFITSVTVELHRAPLAPPLYGSLQRYLDEHNITDYTPAAIRHAVTAIRAAKLPDPATLPSAGSFFKNVFISAAEIPAAEARGIPVWHSADGRGKINSGWLIEQCGLKGQLVSGFRVSPAAALVLINESATGYADLAHARATITAAVYDRFGYRLEQEPVELTTNARKDQP